MPFEIEDAEGIWGHGEYAYGYGDSNIFDGKQHRQIDINMQKRSTFQKAGNAARVITHERLHWIWTGDRYAGGGMSQPGEHSALDSQARSIMKKYGLSSGGCAPMADYPACQ